ncbi:hypothetical protein DES49_2684 [Halospina denitrificans]|uniref:Uncharacterized protein n=1 Tax=Halospina denitrificans TaxID=332522 RepID=A0A4R7JJ37_9GAMM|nr:hypothetical protein [Halospina denitrificans]TDT37725.1 hypothetical protein DES49_2684 [Halospina denitrificans]
MPEVRFARSTRRPSDIVGDDPETLKQFCSVNGLGEHALLAEGRAYSLDTGRSGTKHVVRRLNNLSLPERRNAANAAASMGDDVHALAAFMEENLSGYDLERINSAVNASSGAAHARLNGFQQAVADYQKQLIDLQESYRRHPGPGRGAYLEKLRRQSRQAYQKLEARYSAELKRFAPETMRAKNKGNALSNAERGILLAERSASPAKADPRLNVADTVQADRMGVLSRGFNYLGKIATVADGAFRVGKVKATYDEGGNWLKESSRQMTGFGFGGVAGIYAGKAAIAGGAAFATSVGLMAAGPVGWVALGVILVAGTLVGLGVGYYADQFGKYIAELIWEFG